MFFYVLPQENKKKVVLTQFGVQSIHPFGEKNILFGGTKEFFSIFNCMYSNVQRIIP